MSIKLRNSTLRHLAGWTGGLVEGTEPDLAHPSPYGSVASGLNMQTAPLGRLAVRGGSQVLLTFALNNISDVLGIWPFSPVGAVVLAYDGTAHKHYVYAVTDGGDAFALGTPVSETDSREELTDWATLTKGRPVAVELFETLYIVDASVTGRRPLQAITLGGGSLAVVTPQYDITGSGADDALPYCAAVYNSSLFIAGWDSADNPDAPHFLRNSLLGTAPDDAAGFSPNGYAILGAQGQAITAMEPGREILLVAKNSELYRVFGTGQALDGWFYTIQQVENTQGFGVTNPYALKHVNSYWYGIGPVGPFRTNGTTVEPLGIPWRESWGRVDHLELAWVAHHPDPTKRKIWFGFHETGNALYPTAPFTIWAWDLDRETWSPPHRYPRAFHFVQTLLPGTSGAPSGVPATLEQRFDYGDFGFTEVSGRFVSADLDALTEVWGRVTGGAYTLQTTLPAGIQRFRLTVAAAAKTTFKLRHQKNGTVGDFAGAVVFYPRLPAPVLTLTSPTGRGDAPAYSTATVYNPIQGSSIVVRPTSGAWTESDTDLDVGSFTVDQITTDACVSTAAPDQGATIQAQLEHPDWPALYQDSRIEELVTYQAFCTPLSPFWGPPVRQKLEQGGMQSTQITVRFVPQTTAETYRVQYKLSSEVTWITHSDHYITGAHDTIEVTIGSLVPSSKYHVRVQLVDYLTQFPSQANGTSVDCFTQLAPPVQSVTVIGSAGSPGTRITLTAPYNGASIVSENARETYKATYMAQPGTPVSYDTTVGTCGRPDRFHARTYDATWPDGFQYSDAVSNDTVDPCIP